MAANNNHDALALVLAGFGTLQVSNPTLLNSVISSYGMTINDVAATNQDYKNGINGSKCY